MRIRHSMMPRAFGAVTLFSAVGCSSAGPSEPVPASTDLGSLQASAVGTGARTNAPGFERSFAEDRAAPRATACSAYPQYESQRIATVLGRSLADRRGGVVEGQDACSLLGDGLRVRFVTSRAVSASAANNQCRMLAGSGAQTFVGPGSTAWVTTGGVYAAHNEQCYLTQVIDHGALDTAASLRVAHDVAWRQM
jgi:hypothetical protein